MGILNNKEVYRVSGNPSVGATKTKTLHLADSRPADLGRRAQKLTPLENDFTVLPAGSLIDTPTGPRQAGKVPVQNVRNIIGALHLGIYNECGHYNFNYTHDMYCDKNVKYFELLRPLLQKMAKQYEADYPVNKCI